MAVGNLDAWGQMTRDKILHGWLNNQGRKDPWRNGEIPGYRTSYKVSRGRDFHKAGRKSPVSSGRSFSEILWKERKKKIYGWDFSDNYFDLFPGEEYCIEVKGAHVSGQITAKPLSGKSSCCLCVKASEE